MKKLFALALALCLLCGCTALAENEISWEQVAPMFEQSGITGQWYTLNQIAVKIFVPDGFTPVESTDENVIAYFQSEEGDGICVNYVNVDGMDLETYAAALPQVGATEIETGTLNGFPCVSYEVPANKTVNAAFTTQAGYILEFAMGPIADDNAKLGASFIMASIQAAE